MKQLIMFSLVICLAVPLCAEQAGIIDTHDAWGEYKPVPLQRDSLRNAVPSGDEIAVFLMPDINRYKERKMEIVRRAIDAMPAHVTGADQHRKIGLIYARNGFYEQAETEFIEALKASPNDYRSRNNLANVYRIQGREEDAIREYQYALQSTGDEAKIYLNLALLYFDVGKFNEAAESYACAVQQNAAFESDDLAYLRTGRIESGATTLRAGDAADRQHRVQTAQWFEE